MAPWGHMYVNPGLTEPKRILLNNAWCRDCHDANASFAPGYTLLADKFGIVIEGKCAKYGYAIARCSH